jgi:hypothetical protein
MESGMTAGPGAAGLGQEPEREEGDFRMTDEELRDENLQGSVDALIEDWKSSDYTWWAAQPEGAIALQLLFQVGQKIGEYRARKGQPGGPNSGTNLGESGRPATEAETEQAMEEAATQAEQDKERQKLLDRIDELEAEAEEKREKTPEEQAAIEQAEEQGKNPPDPSPDPTPAADIQKGGTPATPTQREGIEHGTEGNEPR